MTEDEARKEMIKLIASDPCLAHEMLFKHRHSDDTPDFHREMIGLWHDPKVDRLAIQAFRGGAKSTVGCEEASIVMGLLGVYKNGLIIGEKYERACERLAAIKHELDNNEYIRAIFGDCRGKIWTEGKIELFNGTVLQAVGRGQSLRGSKHHDQRPDYVVGDDIEDAESVKTEEAKRATLAWFMSVVMPALDKKKAIIRVIGTPLETNSLMERLAADEGWQSRKFPIEAVDMDGNRVPTWPGRFPLPDIDKEKRNFERMGMLLEYGREYMCEARSSETRQFTQDMMRVVPAVRKWQAVFAMYDPARTVKDTSAHTGKAVWSWIGNRLVIWEASGHFWRPDEIVSDMFECNAKYNPVVIGVEKDGLEEFIMQPIRHEMVKRDCIIPIRAMKAPKGKLDFIRGLQPFFMSGEATMAQNCPDLIEQLLNFPVGRMDVPNALAYALMMRPGLPVYEDFSEDHISIDDLRPTGRLSLAINFLDGVTTGVLLRRGKRGVEILADIILEGDPNQRAKDILDFGYFEADGKHNLDVIVHSDHFDRYSNSGLVGALRKLRCEPRRGGDVMRGRGYVVDNLRNRREGKPSFTVRERAKYVLNAFIGGYAFDYPKAGKGLSDRARDGMYRTLMEGLESAVSLYAIGAGSDDKDVGNYRTDHKGRRYLSSLPN